MTSVEAPSRETTLFGFPRFDAGSIVSIITIDCQSYSIMFSVIFARLLCDEKVRAVYGMIDAGSFLCVIENENGRRSESVTFFAPFSFLASLDRHSACMVSCWG